MGARTNLEELDTSSFERKISNSPFGLDEGFNTFYALIRCPCDNIETGRICGTGTTGTTGRTGKTDRTGRTDKTDRNKQDKAGTNRTRQGQAGQT